MANPYFNPDYNPYPPSVLIGTGVFFIILSMASVALRFYSRSISDAPLDADDWITIPSMVICVGLSVTQLIATTDGGLGGHQELLEGKLAHTLQLSIYEKTKYTYQLMGTIGLWVTKLSVLLFYRRIFSIRVFRQMNNVSIGLTVAWGLAFTFAVAFQCRPLSTIWNEFELEYGEACFQVQPFYLALAISDLILDIIILMLPLPHIWHLQVSLRQRLAIGGILLLGSVVVAIGVTRLIIFQWVIAFTMAKPLVYFFDITWYTAGTLFWQLAENVFGLLGCCLPTYAPLFKHLLQKQKITGFTSDSANAELRKDHGTSRFRRRLDDEDSLTRPEANSTYVLEDYAHNTAPGEGIMVCREFRTDTISQ